MYDQVERAIATRDAQLYMAQLEGHREGHKEGRREGILSGAYRIYRQTGDEKLVRTAFPELGKADLEKIFAEFGTNMPEFNGMFGAAPE